MAKAMALQRLLFSAGLALALPAVQVVVDVDAVPVSKDRELFNQVWGLLETSAAGTLNGAKLGSSNWLSRVLGVAENFRRDLKSRFRPGGFSVSKTLERARMRKRLRRFKNRMEMK